jgi:sec-independent protein translocase protein TatA
MSAGLFAQIIGPDGLIILVVLLVVLVFGGSQLPKLARSLGGASHEFKSASEEFKKAVEGHSEVADHHFPTSTVTVQGGAEQALDAPTEH